jgi:DNA-binding CsgD family transcriptional regulator
MRALDDRLSAGRDHGVTLLLRGAAGVGKSALLAVASHRAGTDGARVSTTSGVRSEAHVAFAGLHHMLQPLLERGHGLARSHRDALLAMFEMDDSSPRATLLIALATLELLAEEAEKMPLVLIVDDAQWLDCSTADVLGLVARRLGPGPVTLLIAVRDGSDTALVQFGLPELRVGPLDEPSSGRLLDSVAPGLNNGVRRRVLAAAAGNPLALVELPVALGSGAPALPGWPDRLPMTARLEQAHLEQFLSLAEATRTTLLVASVDEEACLNEVLSAAALLHDEVTTSLDDLTPAIAAGVVEHDHKGIIFRHPLLPAAIYQAATTAERRRGHAALAVAVTNDPCRRAWHRAASTVNPNEDVAAELEQAFLGATTRGSAGTMLAALERAAELTPDVSQRGQRLLRAAEFAVEVGEVDRASRLLRAIDDADFDPLSRARFTLLRYTIAPSGPAHPRTVQSLVDDATSASSFGAIDLALRLLQAAAMHSLWADPGPETLAQVIATLEGVTAPEGDPRVMSILAICDPTRWSGPLRDIASDIAVEKIDPGVALSLGTALHVIGEFELSATFLGGAMTGLRGQSRLWLLTQALAQHAWNAICTGNWDVARDAAQEAASLARDTQQPLWKATAHTAQSMIAAIKGDDEAAESLLREAEAFALPLGASAVLSDIQLARALIASGHGRYDEAFEHLERTFDPYDPAHHHIRSTWHIGEYVEAAVHAGRSLPAREQLTRLRRLTQRNPSPRLQAALLYARPLLAADDDAETHFRIGLATDQARLPFYRARLLLEYGGWLRRRRKFTESRMPLRTALDTFVALGAAPWAERARQELRAARETRRHQPESWTRLSEQEQQVAHLVSQGLSNREIAQRLYISHRTVGAHLYRIFPKIGVATRAQLQAVIANGTPTTLAS